VPDVEFEPVRSLAVILGASRYPKSPQLAGGRSFSQSASAFADYLTDRSGLTLPPSNLLDLFDDPASPSEQLEGIADFLRGSIDKSGNKIRDLFIYYVGHGGFTPRDQAYFLAIRFTRENNEGATSIRISDLAFTIKESARLLRRYLVLDCCFAASAFKEFQSGPVQIMRAKTAEEFPTRGTSLLCSSSAREASVAPEKSTFTMFSDALLESLSQGSASLGERLSISDLGYLAKESLRRKYPDSWVRPQVLSPDAIEGDISNIPIFPNPVFRQSEHLKAEAVQREQGERQAAEAAQREQQEARRRKAEQEAAESEKPEEKPISSNYDPSYYSPQRIAERAREAAKKAEAAQREQEESM
jgi:hypothetical protein